MENLAESEFEVLDRAQLHCCKGKQVKTKRKHHFEIAFGTHIVPSHLSCLCNPLLAKLQLKLLLFANSVTYTAVSLGHI